MYGDWCTITFGCWEVDLQALREILSKLAPNVKITARMIEM